MKLELGAGLRPTRGYTHNDLHPFPHIEIVGEPWLLDLPTKSVTEVLALGFVEHLTHDQVLDTFRNVRRILTDDGLFLFDVPDYPQWVRYYLHRLECPTVQNPDMAHVHRTLFGWQRWPGDEHKWGWDDTTITDALAHTGLTVTSWRVEPFRERVFRQRFDRPWDAHLYITARPA